MPFLVFCLTHCLFCWRNASSFILVTLFPTYFLPYVWIKAVFYYVQVAALIESLETEKTVEIKYAFETLTYIYFRMET